MSADNLCIHPSGGHRSHRCTIPQTGPTPLQDDDRATPMRSLSTTFCSSDRLRTEPLLSGLATACCGLLFVRPVSRERQPPRAGRRVRAPPPQRRRCAVAVCPVGDVYACVQIDRNNTYSSPGLPREGVVYPCGKPGPPKKLHTGGSRSERRDPVTIPITGVRRGQHNKRKGVGIRVRPMSTTPSGKPSEPQPESSGPAKATTATKKVPATGTTKKDENWWQSLPVNTQIAVGAAAALLVTVVIVRARGA